jgi:hypothetical protein
MILIVAPGWRWQADPPAVVILAPLLSRWDAEPE